MLTLNNKIIFHSLIDNAKIVESAYSDNTQVYLHNISFYIR